jgi:hypothetical protein
MGWIPWIASWITPHIRVDRKIKEIFITILFENPIELRILYLVHSVKKFIT